ncbi:TspO/MBR family protein [Flavicella sp.]|uniref:TspO/MBR family protein n=1 Tax=Flavicella sp. TaxID=2957742 RepID=UPI002633FE49|nr:TspO/MBR family protein [Flavicella sp.]MDG1803745.1 tryptophan-rich sensory protein [Flavicella sp.]
MKTFLRIFLFFVLNFSALGIGTWLMNSGPTSDWYVSMNKAPWTPPGWVFGAAWSTIMICFSFYMAVLLEKAQVIKVWKLFFVQWLLNISWNWVFFNQHQMFVAAIILISLTVFVGYFMFFYLRKMKYFSLLIVPYFLWLLVANSLNIYAIINN